MCFLEAKNYIYSHFLFYTLTSKEDSVQTIFIAGVTVWPQHYRPKYILLIWVLVTLILDFGEQNLIDKIIYCARLSANFNHFKFSIFRVLSGKFDSTNKATIHKHLQGAS